MCDEAQCHGRKWGREGGLERKRLWLIFSPCWRTVRALNGTHIPVEAVWEGPSQVAFFFPFFYIINAVYLIWGKSLG